MRGLIEPVARIRRRGIAEALEGLLGPGAISDCERCGEPRFVVSEERIADHPHVFELGSRCTGCGVIVHMQRAFDGLG